MNNVVQKGVIVALEVKSLMVSIMHVVSNGLLTDSTKVNACTRQYEVLDGAPHQSPISHLTSNIACRNSRVLVDLIGFCHHVARAQRLSVPSYKPILLAERLLAGFYYRR
jgi:hypothetical protein